MHCRHQSDMTTTLQYIALQASDSSDVSRLCAGDKQAQPQHALSTALRFLTDLEGIQLDVIQKTQRDAPELDPVEALAPLCKRIGSSVATFRETWTIIKHEYDRKDSAKPLCPSSLAVMIASLQHLPASHASFPVTTEGQKVKVRSATNHMQRSTSIIQRCQCMLSCPCRLLVHGCIAVI